MGKYIIPKDSEIEDFFISLRQKKIISNNDIISLLYDLNEEYLNDLDENDLIDILSSKISKITKKMKNKESFKDIMDTYFGLDNNDFI